MSVLIDLPGSYDGEIRPAFRTYWRWDSAERVWIDVFYRPATGEGT